ncbi:hypothetical protein PHAMO_10326 [Magnetospirillum molischianum DSM 120]|uniref:Uncharacterized protein n=1 Tax=Magnetospirillum molischianum DSM 120 TaxID=1150626 RepID=H8FNG3_MAGML|nr:hypothetical protein PHAMO_10326 [Magnetospirillum molischianum DSM 120]
MSPLTSRAYVTHCMAALAWKGVARAIVATITKVAGRMVALRTGTLPSGYWCGRLCLSEKPMATIFVKCVTFNLKLSPARIRGRNRRHRLDLVSIVLFRAGQGGAIIVSVCKEEFDSATVLEAVDGGLSGPRDPLCPGGGATPAGHRRRRGDRLLFPGGRCAVPCH